MEGNKNGDGARRPHTQQVADQGSVVTVVYHSLPEVASAQRSERNRLDRLMRSIRGLNTITGGAEFMEDGEVGCAGPTVCEFCGTFELPDCIHKRAARLAVKTWSANDDDSLVDLRDTYRVALGVG